MQYANVISYKYRLTELCILPYPFGLHRLPAPAPEEPQHWTRERLDTPRQHRSGRSASPRSGHGRRDGDSTSGRAARNQSQKRNDRRARASTTAAETRPPADSQPQKSRRDRARAREPEARHCRPRDTDGDRKTKREEKKRGNEEKTTVKRRFSPRLTERPADQPPEPAQHRQTRTAAETPLFRFCFCGVCGTNGDQCLFCYLYRGGIVYIFSTSAMPKIWLCTLFSTPLSFSPNTVSQTHRSSTTYFLTNINIFCYRLLFGRMP